MSGKSENSKGFGTAPARRCSSECLRAAEFPGRSRPALTATRPRLPALRAGGGRRASRPILRLQRPFRLAVRGSVAVESPLDQNEGTRALQQEYGRAARSIIRVEDEGSGEDALPFPRQAGSGQLLIRLHEGAVLEHGKQLLRRARRSREPRCEFPPHAPELRPWGIQKLVRQSINARWEGAREAAVCRGAVGVGAVAAVPEGVPVREQQIEPGVGG